jgi:Flp pilus assembly protein TadD
MKTLLLTFSLISFAFVVSAQQNVDMQKMMQQAQAMQECMAGVDQSAMGRMQSEAEAMKAKIDGLCKAGKRDEAESYAIEAGMKISQDPELQKIRKCGEKMQGMMANMPLPNIPTAAGGENGAKHLCD